MTTISTWTAGASPLCQLTYRLSQDGEEYLLEVKREGDDDACYRQITRGHRVARAISVLLREEHEAREGGQLLYLKRRPA